MLARLLASGSNIWLADEFCTNLDPVTANIVGHNVHRFARSHGITAVLAAPHCEAFFHSLQPDKVILLTSASEHRVFSGQEYMRFLGKSRLPARGPTAIRLRSRFMVAVRKGKKTTTIRMGRQRVDTDLLLLQCGVDELLVRVTGVNYKRFSELTREDAIRDGAKSLKELRETLMDIYPKLREQTTLTVVVFENICGIQCG